MMDDLIKRLNDGIDVIEQTSGGWTINLSGTQSLIAEAAAALSEAQAEVERLRGALREIEGGASPDHWVPQHQHCVDVARAALDAKHG